MAEPSRIEFARRRRALMRLIGRDGIAIVPSAPVRQRNSDVEYNYRQASDFYYLTGFNEPDAVAVLIPGREAAEYVLFVRERNREREIWDGKRAFRPGALAVPDLTLAVALAHEQHVFGCLPARNQHRHRVRLIEAGQVVEIAGLPVVVFDVAIALAHRRRRHDGNAVAANQAHERAAAAREFDSGWFGHDCLGRNAKWL